LLSCLHGSEVDGGRRAFGRDLSELPTRQWRRRSSHAPRTWISELPTRQWRGGA